MPDQQAEDAVRLAMENITAQGKPLNAATVPDAAHQLLLAAGASRADAQERIYRAIDEMVRMGKLTAPSQPWEAWSLK